MLSLHQVGNTERIFCPVWKGCKWEPELGHCESQSEQMPFKHSKNMIHTPGEICQGGIDCNSGGKGDMHNMLKQASSRPHSSYTNFSSWSLSNR